MPTHQADWSSGLDFLPGPMTLSLSGENILVWLLLIPENSKSGRSDGTGHPMLFKFLVSPVSSLCCGGCHGDLAPAPNFCWCGVCVWCLRNGQGRKRDSGIFHASQRCPDSESTQSGSEHLRELQHDARQLFHKEKD